MNADEFQTLLQAEHEKRKRCADPEMMRKVFHSWCEYFDDLQGVPLGTNEGNLDVIAKWEAKHGPLLKQ